MSKLYDALQDQLKTEHKKEAEDCIKIYNVLKAISREKYGVGTKLIEVSEEEVKAAKEKYAKTGECDCIYIYDESSYCGWYLRYCGICESLVSLV